MQRPHNNNIKNNNNTSNNKNNNFENNNDNDIDEETQNINDANIIISNERSRSICSRLDRKESNSWCRSRCNWKSFLASIIIVLLHLTSIECLQARQEGE
jgi:hypothetical protein